MQARQCESTVRARRAFVCTLALLTILSWTGTALVGGVKAGAPAVFPLFAKLPASADRGERDRIAPASSCCANANEPLANPDRTCDEAAFRQRPERKQTAINLHRNYIQPAIKAR